MLLMLHDFPLNAVHVRGGLSSRPTVGRTPRVDIMVLLSYCLIGV
jgi:hypothetical protein